MSRFTVETIHGCVMDNSGFRFTRVGLPYTGSEDAMLSLASRIPMDYEPAVIEISLYDDQD